MEKTLKEYINEIAAEIPHITDIEKFTMKLKEVSGTEYTGKRLENMVVDYFNGIDSGLYDSKKGLIYKDDFFRNTSFHVELTDYEKKHGLLILGDKLIPFVSLKDSLHLKLSDGDSNPLKCENISIPYERNMNSFSFITIFEASNLFELKGNKINVNAFDISEILAKTDVEKNLVIEFTPVDYDNVQYSVKITEVDLDMTERFRTYWENAFSACSEFSYKTCERFLFNTMIKLPQIVLKNTIQPLKMLIESSAKIELFYTGTESQIRIKGYELVEDIMEKYNSGKSIPKSSVKSIDDVLIQLQCPYNGDYVFSFMLLQYVMKSDFDYKELSEKLFGVESIPFVNENQKKVFDDELPEVENTVRRTSGKYDVESYIELLKAVMSLKDYQIDILLRLENKMMYFSLLDPEILEPLDEVDEYTGGFFHSIKQWDEEYINKYNSTFKDRIAVLKSKLAELEKAVAELGDGGE